VRTSYSVLTQTQTVQYSQLHTYAIRYSLLLLGYKPVQHVTALNTVGNCNTMVSIILYYNIMGPPSYMRSVNWNVIVRLMTVMLSPYICVWYICFLPGVGWSRDRFPVVTLGIFSMVPPAEPCALGSTQPLKVSTRDFSWGKGGRCVWLTTYHPCSAEMSRKSGALIYPEPLEPPRPVAGLLYFTYFSWLSK